MVPFRSKPVRVTTKEELDAALASPATKNIVVEGDDELLTYAAQKASSDPDLDIGRVAIERQLTGIEPLRPECAAGRSERPSADLRTLGAPPDSDVASASAGPTPPGCAQQTSLPTPPTPREASSLRLLLAWVAVLAVLLGGILAGSHMAPRTRPPDGEIASAPQPPAAGGQGGGGGWSAVQHAQPIPRMDNQALLGGDTRAGSEASESRQAAPRGRHVETGEAATPALMSSLPAMLWPAVAIVAIVALYLVARQAISTGSNVEIHWKVTEKVTGRLVISKQTARSAKRAA